MVSSSPKGKTYDESCCVIRSEKAGGRNAQCCWRGEASQFASLTCFPFSVPKEQNNFS